MILNIVDSKRKRSLEESGILMRTGFEKDALEVIKENKEELKNWKNVYGNKIESIAAWNCCIKVLSYLVSIKYNFNIDMISIYGARHFEVLVFLKENNILNPNAKSENGTTPLHQACNIFNPNITNEKGIENRVKSIDFLIKNGADVNEKNNENRTIIMGAIYTSSKELIEKLIEHKADCSPYIKCKNNKSAIQYAKTKEIQDIVRRAIMKTI